MVDVGCCRLFACDECDMVEELDFRLANARKYGYDFQFYYCGCEKVGCYFGMGGYCEDAWSDYPEEKPKGKRKTGRAYRRAMRVQKFNRQKEIVETEGSMVLCLGYDHTGLPCPNVWGMWHYGVDDDEMTPAYIRKPKNSKYKRYYKKYANKKTRRTKIIGQEKGWHKRTFDLAWTLW